MTARDEEIGLRPRGAGSTGGQRRGDVVLRPAGPWTPTLHSLLRHLEDVGFAGSPRVVGTGFAADGRETLSYIEGEVADSGPGTVEGALAIGNLLRELHETTASFRPEPDATWAESSATATWPRGT